MAAKGTSDIDLGCLSTSSVNLTWKYLSCSTYSTNTTQPAFPSFLGIERLISGQPALTETVSPNSTPLELFSEVDTLGRERGEEGQGPRAPLWWEKGAHGPPTPTPWRHCDESSVSGGQGLTMR